MNETRDDEAPVRDAVEVLVEEFFDRRRRGDPSDVADFARRVPGREAEFREMVAFLCELETAGATPPAARAPGSTLGRFELVRLLGRGGMGSVYEAVDREHGRRVALKVLPGHATLDAREIERFRREAQAAARLHHPHIVPILGVGEDDGVHWIAMQLVPGESLDRVLRAARDSAGAARLPPHDAARHAQAVAEAIAAAHAEGVLHRDVKPSNLLLDPSGTIWVTDFGLAKTEGAATLTRSGETVGTPRYMAPEAFSGWADPRTDVWGVGVTLYELLAGRPAFDGLDRARLLKQIADEEPPPLRRLDPAIPVELATIVQQCLQKEPAGRYASARELADDLARFLAGEPVRARPPSALRKLAQVVRRHRRATAATLGAAALVVALLVGWIVTLDHKNANLRIEQGRTEANLEVAEAAIDHLLSEWSENTLVRVPANEPMRRQLLLDALELQQRLLAARQDDPRLRFVVAESRSRIGLICFALDRYGEAQSRLEEAARSLEALLAESPGEISVSLQLSRTCEGLARVASARGDVAAQDAALRESLHALDGAAPRGFAALPAAEQEDYARHRLSTVGLLARSQVERREARAAATQLRAELASLRAVLERETANPASLRTLAFACNALGDACERSGDIAGACAALEPALALGRRLSASDPGNVHDQIDFAVNRSCLGSLLTRAGRLDEARGHLESARDDLEQLLRAWPTATTLRDEIAQTLRRLVEEERARDPESDGTALLRRALELADARHAEVPDDLEVSAAGVALRSDLATLLDERGDAPAAAALLREAVERAMPLVDDEARRRVVAAQPAAFACYNAGIVAGELGDPDAACRAFDRSIELCDWLRGGDGSHRMGALLRVRAFGSRASARARLGQGELARADVAAAESAARELDRQFPVADGGDVAFERQVADVLLHALNCRGNDLLQHGDRAGAAAMIADAIAGGEAALARWPESLPLLLAVGMARADAANVVFAGGDEALARDGLARALADVDAVLARTPRQRAARGAATWIVDKLACTLSGEVDVRELGKSVAATVERIGDDPEARYAAARFDARAAACRRGGLAAALTLGGATEPEADAAIAQLRAAVAAGLARRERLRDDEALEVLQRRADYRRWLDELGLAAH